MANQSNPAGRLHELIVRAAATPNPKGALTIKDAWRHALDVDPDDSSTLLRRIGLMYALPAQIRAQVSELPGETHELYLRHLPRIEAALEVPLQCKWANQFYAQVNGEPLLSLEFCSDRLDKAHVEAVLDGDQVSDLRQRIDDLHATILTSSIDDDLRTFLSRHAQAMRQAIEEVQLRGAEALRDVAEATIGAIVIRRHVDGEPKDRAGKSAWRKLGEVAAGLLVVANAGRTIEFGHELYDALPMAAGAPVRPA